MLQLVHSLICIMFQYIFALGFRRLFQLGLVIFFVSLLSVASLIVHFVLLFEGGLHAGEWARLIILLLGSVALMLFTLWRIYAVLMLDVFKLFYDQFKGTLQKFSQIFILSMRKNTKVSHIERGRALEAGLQSVPWVIRLPLKLILDQIPALKLSDSIKKAMLEPNEKAAAEQFSQELGEWVEEVYFEATSLMWLIWVAVAFILLQGFMLFFLLGN